MTMTSPVRTWPLVLAITIAGALAVPLDPIATPVSTAVAAALGLLGLRVWRWSRLPDRLKPAPPGRTGRFLLVASSLGIGLAVGLAVLGVIRLVLEPAIPAIGARMAAAGTLPVWRRALIIYVAAVGEELLFRLLLLSLLAGLAARLLRRANREPAAPDLWTANLLAALAFGLVHLPAWTGLATMTAGLAACVVALNMGAGLVLGQLFVTRGILAAILAHAAADCALQLIGPLTG